jgi:hypothetical protein
MSIKPLAETRTTVTLSRADYEALLASVEDRLDLARLHEVEQKLARGESEELPIEMVERLIRGESPLRVWREHSGLGVRELARSAGVDAGYLSQIETGAKPGSVKALRALAAALRVDLDDLAR